MKRFADVDVESDDAKRMVAGGGGAAVETTRWNLDECLRGADDPTSLTALRATATAFGVPETVATTRDALCHEMAAREPWREEHIGKLETIGLQLAPVERALDDYIQTGDERSLDNIAVLLATADRKQLNKALARAVSEGSEEWVEALLDAGADPNMRIGTDRQPIIMAANADILPLLIKHLADVNVVWENKTPLSAAIIERDALKMKMLLDVGAQTNPSTLRSAPLEFLIAARRWDLVHLMLQYGATVGNGYDRITDAMIALLKEWHRWSLPPFSMTSQQKVVILQKLIQWGANVNVRSPNSPLDIVMEQRPVDQLALATLLQAGANVNVGKSVPPLRRALHRDFATVRTLLQHGADVNVVYEKNIQPNTILMQALSTSSMPRDIIEQIVKKEDKAKIARNGFGQVSRYMVALMNAAIPLDHLDVVLENTTLSFADAVDTITYAFPRLKTKHIDKMIPFLHGRFGEALLRALSSAPFLQTRNQPKQRQKMDGMVRWYLDFIESDARAREQFRTLVDEKGNSALMLYVMNSPTIDRPTMQQLMNMVDVNQPNSAGQTAWSVALQQNNELGIDELIAHGQNVTHANMAAVPKSFDATYPTLWVDFQREKILGRGASGVVYKVRHRQSGRHYALKVINDGALTNSTPQRVRERLDGELKGIARVSQSPNCSLRVACLYGYFSMATPEDPNRYAILMDLVHGQTLSRAVKHNVSSDMVVAWIRGLLLALAEIHAKGVAHRDLHPGNIIVTQQPAHAEDWKNVSETLKAPIVLIDLGSACLKRVALDNALVPYSCASERGNRDYWSPQLTAAAAAQQPLDFAAWAYNDVYSAGLSVLQSATRATIEDVRESMQKPGFVDKLNIDSPYIREFLRRTVAPDAQPITARALLQHLEKYSPRCAPFDATTAVHLKETPRRMQSVAAMMQESHLSDLGTDDVEQLNDVIVRFTADSTSYRNYLQNKHYRPGYIMGNPETFAMHADRASIERLEAFAMVNVAATYTTTLYRGVFDEQVMIGTRATRNEVQWKSRLLNVDAASRFETGQVLSFGTLLSTSHEPQKAIGFMKLASPLDASGCYACCLLQFEIPSGYPRVDVAAWSKLPQEREVVLPAHVLTEEALRLKRDRRLDYRSLLANFDKWTTLAKYTVKSVKNANVMYRAHPDTLSSEQGFDTRVANLGHYKDEVAPLQRMHVKLITLVPANGSLGA